MQIIPAVYIEHAAIPAIVIGASFTYLGKIFNSSMKNEKAIDALSTKLISFIDVTNSLQISVQTKLKILKDYILYNFSDFIRIKNLLLQQNVDRKGTRFDSKHIH